MTTFATTADTRSAAPRLARPAAVGRLTDWIADWRHAFRAAAAAPRPEGMDPGVLARFGRA